MTMKKDKNAFTIGGLTIESRGGKKPLRMTIDGRSTDVEYKELWGVVYVLGDRKHKTEMIPVQKKEMMQFVRKYTIEAKNDIKQGELITFWAEINVPETVVAAIAEENGAKVVRPGVPEEMHA